MRIPIDEFPLETLQRMQDEALDVWGRCLVDPAVPVDLLHRVSDVTFTIMGAVTRKLHPRAA